jgi:hypothetical protein
VDFENYEEAARAIRERDHKVFSEKFGDRYVRLIQVRPAHAQGAAGLERRPGALLHAPGAGGPGGAPPIRPPLARPPSRQVSRKEMQATLALRFGGEGILKVKGIPFKASAADVRKFFSGYKIKGEGVSFIMHSDGRPTGMAFIEFESPQEAVKAMDKDRTKFGPEYGDRFCMLQLVGRHEMDKVGGAWRCCCGGWA